MFKKILIANRGEIAMRILRCCREMGIQTVVVYSTEDKESLPVQFSTESVCIGPALASKSYLNEDALLSVAKEFHCDAIHPGYGFLSENAYFARECEKNSIEFIGPSAKMIHLMGNKDAARSLMKKHGVPVVPGSDGILKDVEEAKAVAEEVGYPVLIKASAGGGGRGMRVAHDESEIEDAYESAGAEALSAFGDGSLYLEKLIVNPHHIEVQILGDKKGNIIHLLERDCSMQRRHQKILEECPASILTPRQREALYRTAIKAARAVHYYSAGTVEFVLDSTGKFYFIEMNTRIQVEHPVTEMVTGVDLIREQIRVAAGMPLSVKQSDIKINGHSIECRINAEDPQRDFAPCPGEVTFLHFPNGNGIRVESAVYQNSRISPYYDSMIAKIIVHARGRLEAIRKMRVALEELTVKGIKTNTDFQYLIMYNEDFLMGNYDTGFLEKNTEAILKWNKESEKFRG